MNKTLGLVVAAGIFASAAMGANLNVSVEQPDGSNTINVLAGATVEYSVMGQLDTDADNRGLALAGFDLELLNEGTGTQAAPLPQADEPTGVEMLNFAVPEGINNPAGFGGTDSGGKLLQVGGAQNTINNTLDCTVDADCPGASNLCDGGTCTASAPFPLGTVIENLGHTEIELAKGSLTVPNGRGGTCYVLALTDLFANVISTTQNSPDFLATEAAGAGTIDNLTICIETCAAAAVLTSAPADQGSLWRSGKNIMRFGFDRAVVLPDMGDIQIFECLGNPGAADDSTVDMSGDFNITVDPLDAEVLMVVGKGATTLNHRSWYKIVPACGVTGAYREFLLQIGDCDGNKFVTPADLSCINTEAAIPGMKPDDARCDIDGNRFCTPADLSNSNSHSSGFVPNNCD